MATQAEIRQYIASLESQGLSGDDLNRAIYQGAMRHGVGASDLSDVMGIPLNTIKNWVSSQGLEALPVNNPLAGPTATGAPQGQYGTQEVAGYIQNLRNQGLQGEQLNRAIYDAARQHGIGTGQVADAMGIPTSEVNQWIAQQNLRQLEAPEYGLAATTGTLDRAITGVQRGGEQARADLLGGVQSAEQRLAPYAQTGQQAFNVQAALSGAMGPEAQAQAYADFQASPGQQWLQEQGERAITRNAAAIGGLGGGNVRQELQRQAMGMAAQDFGNYYNRLSGLGQTGMNTAGALGQSDIQAGRDLSGVATGTAGSVANLLGGQAGYQMQAGRDIASNAAQTTQALANLQAQQGQQMSNLYGGTTGSIADLYSQTGSQMAALPLTAANYLGNLAMTGAGGISGGFTNIGQAQAAGAANQYGAMVNALKGLEV